jgi:stage II sporulation protein AB (anti-sigma F factor)
VIAIEIQYRSEERTGMEQFNMEFESHSDNEEFARVVAAVFISRLNPTLEEINDVKTAVSEAVTNAEIHGYEGGEGIIRMQIRIEDRTVTILVQDQGVGIPDIRRAMEPLYTTDRSGERSGMGFSFMEAFMDEVQVESEPGSGTTVTLKKTIGR